MKKKFIFILEVPSWPFKDKHKMSQGNKKKKLRRNLLELKKVTGCLLGRDIITLVIIAGGIFWLANKFDFTLIGAVILGYAIFAIIKNLDSRISAFFALLFLVACPFLLILKEEELAEFSAIYAYYSLVICVFQEIAVPIRKFIKKKFHSTFVWNNFLARKLYSFKKSLRISKQDFNLFRKDFWERLSKEIGKNLVSFFFLVLFFISLRYYTKIGFNSWAFYSTCFLFLVSLFIKIKNKKQVE